MECGGYDYDLCGTENPDLRCVICLRLMRDPVRLACNHKFCKSCLQTHVQLAYNSLDELRENDSQEVRMFGAMLEQ